MEIQNNSNFNLPPGFRFHPSDEELIVHYLKKKTSSLPIPASIIAEVDLYKYNPWELPKKALFGHDEWYFFSPRDRKYPNGARPNRAAASGYWKATGTDKPILMSCGSHSLGVKKALVFYKGRPPKGTKTNWIMHEYRLPETTIKPSRSKSSMRLDDWVLCRVRQKDNAPMNIGDDQTTSAAQTFELFPPKIENSPLKNLDPTYNIVNNYLNNDLPMMAYILSSQNIPCIESSSNISFQVSTRANNHSSSVYEDVSNMGSSPITDSSINSLMNPLKRKPIEGHPEYDQNLLQVQPNKKNKYETLLPSTSRKLVSNKSTDFSFCGQYLPLQNIFNANASAFSMEFQDILQ